MSEVNICFGFNTDKYVLIFGQFREKNPKKVRQKNA